MQGRGGYSLWFLTFLSLLFHRRKADNPILCAAQTKMKSVVTPFAVFALQWRELVSNHIASPKCVAIWHQTIMAFAVFVEMQFIVFARAIQRMMDSRMDGTM